MVLYTGYYALLKKYEQNNLIAVSISNTVPEFYSKTNRLSYKPLAPNSNIVFDYKNKKIDEQEFIKLYKKQLKQLDPNKVLLDIQELTHNSENIILLCWEKYGTFCHRQIVSKWFNHYLNLEIKEYGV